MFDFVRNHQRLMQFVLLLFIFPSFAFVGVQSYSRFADDANTVAKVGGTAISQQEYENALREQTERLRQAYGSQFDPKLLETPEARQAILDNLIAQKALAAEANRNRLTVTNQTLQQKILEIPGMIGPDGKFDSERYKSLVAMQGMNPAMFEQRLRQDLVLQQVNAAVQLTAFAPKTVAGRLSDLNDQEREVQQMAFKAADFASKVNVTDAMIKDYYDKHPAQFEVPEQAKAEYVVLSLDTIASQITVSDAEIADYYKNNQARYTTEEQRRASHILIAAKKDAPAAEKQAAKAKAEKLLAEVRKNPGSFAKVAKENSQDPGSAERGGDLDFFGKGMMTKPFENTVFKLKEGEISDVVETDFGYHIIQLTGIKPGAAKPLEEVKGEIAADIKKQQAQKKFAEMAEVFSNTVYEQADSLKPVADKLKLAIQTQDGLTRQPNPMAGPSPVNNEKFLKALFSDDSVKNKRNTEAVETAPSTLVAGRIVDYKPKTMRPLADVTPVVKERVIATEAAALARKAGEEKLAALKAKDETTGFSEAKTVSRTKPGEIDGKSLQEVMKADASKLPAFVGVDLGTRGYAVYRIGKVTQPANPDAARRDAERQQIGNLLAQHEMLAYLDALKQKAKTKILRPVGAAPAADGDKKDAEQKDGGKK